MGGGGNGSLRTLNRGGGAAAYSTHLQSSGVVFLKTRNYTHRERWLGARRTVDQDLSLLFVAHND